MKFNRNTIILVLSALTLGSIVYILEVLPQSNHSNQDNSNLVAENEKIFSFETDDITNIVIKINDHPNPSMEGNNPLILEFVKRESEINFWEMKQPIETKASDASLSFLLNLFPQATRQTNIPISESSLVDYGLDNPQAIIFLTLNNGDKYEIYLGNSNFDDSQIYSLVKFPSSAIESEGIFLISKSFQYGVERDLNDWQSEIL